MLKYKKSFIQFIKFVFVGISNTVISYVAYFILIKIGLHYIVASVVGFLMSVLNSFYWNNKYVFHSYCHDTRSIGKGLVKTFIAYAGSGLVLSNLLLIFWVVECYH